MPIGPGALDSRGVWQFGEADVESLASDLLNLLAGSVSTQFAADRVRLAALEALEYAWTAFAPAVTGAAIGTGGSAASVHAYRRIAPDLCHIRGKLVLGTGGGAGVTGIPTIALPFSRAALQHPYEPFDGSASLYDVSATTPYKISAVSPNADVTKLQLVPVNSGAITTTISSINPFTFAAGDVLAYSLLYRTV